MERPASEPWLVQGRATVYHGDCVEVMAAMPAASIDAIVTDPPYGIEFMGKDWDAFRVGDRHGRWSGERSGSAGSQITDDDGRPGGARVAYGGQRPTTSRCVTCGKRDAFRNPHACGDAAEWVKEAVDPNAAPPSMVAFQEWTRTWAVEALRVLKPGGHLLAFGGTRTSHRLTCGLEDAGFEIRDCLAWLYGQGFPKSLDVSKAIDKAAGAERELVAVVDRTGKDAGTYGAFAGPSPVTAPATEDAARWEGWGTALKPAHEPIIMARKPLAGTVAGNVLAHGTGALNIDACRIETGDDLNGGAYSGDPRQRDEYTSTDSSAGAVPLSRLNRGVGEFAQPSGRWPANLILDAEAAAMLDAQAPAAGGGGFPSSGNGIGSGDVYGAAGPDFTPRGTGRVDANGGASRFFYTAKASTGERVGSRHPTVKPLDLMRWLVRLVTPPGGLVLDPFAGSGTTGQAALAEGFGVVLIEREAEYLADIRTRLRGWGAIDDDSLLAGLES